MESKQAQSDHFDPKQYYKQITMNFNGQCDEMDNDDLMDEEMAFTPSANTEEGTLRHMNTANTAVTKAEYDLDMDDTEETKEEQTLGVVSVPVENVRQASKSLGIEMLT